MNSKKWKIIFDYDDTLIRHDSKRELEYVAEYLGLDFTDELRWQFSSFYSQMGMWLPKGRVTKKVFGGLLFQIVPLLWQNNISLDEYFKAGEYKEKKIRLATDGVFELLEYLKRQGYYMCILTNGFWSEQTTSIKEQGLAEYFDAIYTWDHYYAKPDKRAFYRALAGTLPENSIMVGNNLLHDIIPAKEIGIYTFGVHLNYEKENSIMPHVELNNLLELKKYL